MIIKKTLYGFWQALISPSKKTPVFSLCPEIKLQEQGLSIFKIRKFTFVNDRFQNGHNAVIGVFLRVLFSKKLFIVLMLLIGLLIIATCTQKQNKNQYKFIAAKHPHLRYQGRIDKHLDTLSRFFWPGSSVKIRFYGKRITAILKDDTGNTFYNVIIDGDSIFMLRPDKEKTTYQLADIPVGEHTIELFRRTEFITGNTSFYGFELDTNATILALSPKDKHIVFYGNSVTTGYANEDTTGADRPDSIFTNNYMAYGAITARHFNAKYTCIARGGIGFMVSWFPLTMPELYDRLNPRDIQSKWNFDKEQPQIVIINIGQNDSWILENPRSDEYQYRFGNKEISKRDIIKHYQNFIIRLRKQYPGTNIICTLGSMDVVAPGSQWPSLIKTAIQELDEPGIYMHIFPFLASKNHPKIADHQRMSRSLINFINANKLWQLQK